MFQKFTRSEKVDVVKPAVNSELNHKLASKPSLDDVKKASAGPYPDCDCVAPCGNC